MGKPSVIHVQRKFLSDVRYPCGRDELVAHAEARDADDKVLAYLRAMPDLRYDGPAAVRAGYGGGTDELEVLDTVAATSHEDNDSTSRSATARR